MKNLLKEEWDIAIILDACRYDSFEKLYKDYLPEGMLEKREGIVATRNWLLENFPDKYDNIIYVSGHPAINSKGIKWNGWDPSGKFFKICDVWLTNWNEKIDTTDPKAMAEKALELINEPDNTNKKIIVHFMQPHSPYRNIEAPKELFGFYVAKQDKKKSIFSPFIKKIAQFVDKHNLTIIYWKLRKMCGLKCKDREEYYWRNFLKDELFEYYEDNLKWVFENLTYFFRNIKPDKKVIVTSDHGEAFGERGEFFHRLGGRSDAVVHVPFYRVINPDKIAEESNKNV